MWVLTDWPNGTCPFSPRRPVKSHESFHLWTVSPKELLIRHFSVAPYITICPSTETYFGLYLRGAMSEVTGIYIFRLLLNIIFFALRSFFTLTNSAYPDEMPHDGISPVCKCKKHVPKNILHN